MQLLKILSVYAAVGHTSLVLGIASLVASQIPDVIKVIAPVLAPHLQQIDAIVNQLEGFDFLKLTGVNAQAGQHVGVHSTNRTGTATGAGNDPMNYQQQQQPNQEYPTSSRVEEISAAAYEYEYTHVSAFCFGQTASGKTYTMFGGQRTNMSRGVQRGLISRSIEYLSQQLAESGVEFSLKLSCVEIFHEEVFDLIAASNKPFEVIEDEKGEYYIQGLQQVACSSYHDWPPHPHK